MRSLRMIAITLLLTVPVLAGPITLTGVPSYSWYHGCAPTAAASVFGYWDIHGYPNLFTASGVDVYLTSYVQDQISSPAHNAKYDPTPDRTDLPAPPATSIADFMQTSVDPLGYGATGGNRIDDGLTGYASYRGYKFDAYNFYTDWHMDKLFSWTGLVAEISAGRPMVFIVDCDGDRIVDHAIPVLGYDDRGTGGQWYGYYTTWSEDETVSWAQYHTPTSGDPWGIASAIVVIPRSPPLCVP